MSNQQLITDMGYDGYKIPNMDLSEILGREWDKNKWYSVSAIASKLGNHRKTAIYWREIGIKIKGIPIRLKMIKRPVQWYSKGKWIIDFFLKTNFNVDIDL